MGGEGRVGAYALTVGVLARVSRKAVKLRERRCYCACEARGGTVGTPERPPGRVNELPRGSARIVFEGIDSSTD